MTTTTAENLTQEAAFNQVKDQAAAVPAGTVRRRGDVNLALDNITTGLTHLENQRAVLQKRWAAERVAQLWRARPLALATVYASSRAFQLDAKEKYLLDLIAQMFDQRDKFFFVLDMAVRWGLLPAERVAKLHEGRGPIDGGQDLVDGVTLCREFAAALANKTPLTEAFLAECETLGNRVVDEVKVDGARKAGNPTAKEAADLANRLWTLLLEAHAEMRKAGFELWGEQLDAYVPLLQSRLGGSKPKNPKPTP